jgi:asparagine N-glycosylation enzyme membrane subunit Stt3
MKDLKASIWINLLAAIGIVISFFVYEPYTYVRIVLLIFAFTEPMLLYFQKKMERAKLWFWTYCIFILSSVFLAYSLDEPLMNTSKLFYFLLFTMVLLTATYKGLLQSNKQCI